MAQDCTKTAHTLSAVLLLGLAVGCNQSGTLSPPQDVVPVETSSPMRNEAEQTMTDSDDQASESEESSRDSGFLPERFNAADAGVYAAPDAADAGVYAAPDAAVLGNTDASVPLHSDICGETTDVTSHLIDLGAPMAEFFESDTVEHLQGRRITDLQEHGGHIYVSGGSAQFNLGPIPVVRWNQQKSLWERTYNVSEEAIDRFVVIGGDLIIPGADPTEDWSLETSIDCAKMIGSKCAPSRKVSIRRI